MVFPPRIWSLVPVSDLATPVVLTETHLVSAGCRVLSVGLGSGVRPKQTDRRLICLLIGFNIGLMGGASLDLSDCTTRFGGVAGYCVSVVMLLM